MLFQILTSGPCPVIEAKSTKAAIEYVKRYASLKRGWTHKVVKGNNGVIHVERYNSKGNLVKGYTVAIQRTTKAKVGNCRIRKVGYVTGYMTIEGPAGTRKIKLSI